MATTYPTSKQDLDPTRGTDNQRLDNPNHVTHHTNEDDTIEALQDKVGIDGDTNTSSHDYKLSEITSTDKSVGKTATQTLTNKTLTAPKINVGSDTTNDIYYRNGSGEFTRLPIGNANEVFGVNSTGDGLEYKTASTVTTDEKNALVGTVGTPSATNKYVTNDDTATTGAGKVLRLDGSGNFTAGIGTENLTDIYLLDKDLTGTTITNTVTETTLYSYTVPANQLGTAEGVRMKVWIKTLDSYQEGATTGRNLILRFKYGSTTLFAKTILGGNIIQTGYLEFLLFGNGSTSSQYGLINISTKRLNVDIGTIAAGTPVNWVDNGSSAEDSTGALAMTITAEWSFATPEVSIVTNLGMVNRIRQ